MYIHFYCTSTLLTKAEESISLAVLGAFCDQCGYVPLKILYLVSSFFNFQIFFFFFNSQAFSDLYS